jgi:hypothetical protein
MTLAITAEQDQLVDAVRRFAARYAPIDKTRAAFGSIAAMPAAKTVPWPTPHVWSKRPRRRCYLVRC